MINRRGDVATGLFDLTGFYGNSPCCAVFEEKGTAYIVEFETDWSVCCMRRGKGCDREGLITIQWA